MPLFLLLAGALGILGLVWMLATSGVPGGTETGAPLAGPVDAVAPDGGAEPIRQPESGPARTSRRSSDRGPERESSGSDPAIRAGGEAIEVSVVDRLTGESIAGATVIQFRPEGNLETASDGDGRLELAPLGVPLRIQHPEYIEVFAPHIPATRPLRIELSRRLALIGRLVDEAGRALPDLSVRLGGGLLSIGTDLEDEIPVDRLTRSDVDGRFEFRDLAPETYNLLIAEAAPEFAPRFEERVELWPDDDGERTFVLNHGATLSGRIRWRGTPTPVAGVRVEVSPGWDLWEGGTSPVNSATSDAEGQFEVAGLARGEYEVHLRAPWGAMVHKTVTSPGAGETFEYTFDLRQPAQVSGRVFDGSGERVPGARVWITSRPEGREFDWTDTASTGIESPFLLSGIANAQGEYRFDAVPTREALWILALAPGPAREGERPDHFEPLRVTEGQVRTGVDLTLAATVELSGVVTDDEDRPLAGVRVEAWHARWGRVSEGRLATTDGTGRFVVGPLPIGPTRVEFSRDGYLDAVQGVQLEDGENVIEEELVTGHPITGWVVDEAGLGVVGATVKARAVAGSGSQVGPRRGDGITDAFGAFEIGPLPERRWTITAKASGYSPVDKLGVEVVLPGPSGVQLVLAARERIETGAVHGEICWAASGRPVWDLDFQGTRGGVARLSGAEFEVHGIRPGRLKLRAVAPGMEPLVFDRVDVLPGMTVDVGRHEVARATRVTVAVRDASGALVDGGAEVRVEPLPVEEGGCGSRQSRRGFTESDRKGIYKHDAIPRCRWRLRVSREGFAPHSEVVRISGPRQSLAVFLRPG